MQFCSPFCAIAIAMTTAIAIITIAIAIAITSNSNCSYSNSIRQQAKNSGKLWNVLYRQFLQTWACNSIGAIFCAAWVQFVNFQFHMFHQICQTGAKFNWDDKRFKDFVGEISLNGVKSQFGQMWNDFAQSCLFKRVFFARFFKRVTEKESRDLKLLVIAK